MAVTLPPNRYSDIVFQCAACGCLDYSRRAHSITCSPRCRTWLHRHPAHIAELVAACDKFSADLPMVLQVRAVALLRPDLLPAIHDGSLELDATRADVYRAFIGMVMETAAKNAG